MSALLDAGVPITRALSQRQPQGFKRITNEISTGIELGAGNFSELAKEYPTKFNILDLELIEVGERTGKLPQVFNSLSEWYRVQGRMRNQLISQMVYPAMLYHFAALVMPCISFLVGGGTLEGVLLKIAAFILPPWLLILGFFGLNKLQQAIGIRFMMPLDSLILYIPLIGNLIRKMDYARFFHSYSMATGAGILISEAAKLGSNACKNNRIKKAFALASEKVEKEGCPFIEAWLENIFPLDRESMAVTMMETGETSGCPDETAKRVAEIYQEEVENTINIIVKIVPTLLYIGIVLYIAFNILAFWGSIFGKINQLTN